eukprot:5180067-Pleurochrysis_carterae.AAC.1
MLCRFMQNLTIDCYSRAEELLNYLYSTKGMTLVLGGKTISVPHFDILRDAGDKEINYNETVCTMHHRQLQPSLLLRRFLEDRPYLHRAPRH